MPIRKRSKESWEIYLDTGLDPVTGKRLPVAPSLPVSIVISQEPLLLCLIEPFIAVSFLMSNFIDRNYISKLSAQQSWLARTQVAGIEDVISSKQDFFQVIVDSSL